MKIRFLGLHLPKLSLQAWLLEDKSLNLKQQCLGILDSEALPKKGEQSKLLHFSTPTAAHRLSVGMRASQALSRCPDLRLLPRRPDLELRAQKELLRMAESISPDYEESSPGLCCIDLGGLPNGAPGSHVALKAFLNSNCLAPLQIEYLQAPTPDLALLGLHATQQFPERKISSPQEIKHLPLNFAACLLPKGERQGFFELMSLWGIHSISDFLALDSQDLTQRLGIHAYHLQQRLDGKSNRPLNLHRPSPEFHIHYDLEDPVESLAPLFLILRRLLSTLGTRLQHQHRSATAVELTLYPLNHARYHKYLPLARPTTDTRKLLDLLDSHLSQFQAASPIHSLRLALIPGHNKYQSKDAFQPGLRDPNQLSDTLTRIETMLGSHRIGIPRDHPSHHPDTFHLQDWRCLLKAPKNNPILPTPQYLSLQRYRPPLPVEVESHPTPTGALPRALLSGPHLGRIYELAGPYFLSGNWWDPKQLWRRIEWNLRMDDGTLLRLAQLSHRWQVEGVFI